MAIASINPATGERVWSGPAASPEEVGRAVARAREAFPLWARVPLGEREAHLRAFSKVIERRTAELASAISREVGKPSWEARTEVQSMVTKADYSVQGHARRCAEFTGGPAVTRFRPHGVVAVFGPFNFPGHLPNGHIMPSLLAGNTVVYKPSEYAPLVGELMASAWSDVGLPQGVFNLVQGARETGQAIATHPGIDGLFFTGSSRTGLWLAELFARTPEKILALELGGNNALVVHSVANRSAAVLLAVQSAYVTAGQRCTCARRIIVPVGAEGDAFVAELAARVGRIKVGSYTDRPEPFMGPVISARASGEVLQTQARLISAGAKPLVVAESLRENTGLLSPGLLDSTGVKDRGDEEIFGPLPQIIRVPDFEAAIAEANRTSYGLTAGLVSDDAVLYARFYENVRAGVVNWNQQLTFASGAVPFGGIGRSGNHRPSGLFAADYCSYPVASIEVPELKFPATLPPGLE